MNSKHAQQLVKIAKELAADGMSQEEAAKKFREKFKGKDPVKDFNLAFKDTLVLLKRMEEKVKKLDTDFKKQPEHWGYVGTIQHLRYQLQELLGDIG